VSRPGRGRLFRGGAIAPGAPPIVFVHIQKTAGTAFRAHLARHFRAEEIAPPYLSVPDALEAVRDKRLVAGHFSLARAMPLFPGAVFMTFLRDPVARIQSQYRSFHDPANLTEAWRQRLPEAQLGAIEFAQGASFEEFLFSDHPTLRHHTDNLQTFCLADHGLDGAAALESAARNLEGRIRFFGLRERFADSIELFRATTGSRRDFAVPAAQWNRSAPAELGLSARGRERLAELVALDVVLYQAGTRLFDRRLAEARSIWRPLRRIFTMARPRPRPSPGGGSGSAG